LACVLCNDARLHEHQGRWELSGDPTEIALVVLAEKLGMSRKWLDQRYELIEDQGFSYERKFHAIIHRSGEQYLVSVAGAPEALAEWGRLTQRQTERVVEIQHEMSAQGLRVLAVGHKQQTSYVVTYQAYHDKMAALMDATFPGRGALVQSGVDDVASHLAPADPTAPANALVVFPEDAGLPAAFIGTRGALARAQTESTLGILNLIGTYGPPVAY